MSQDGGRAQSWDVGAWSLLRGKKDGEDWATHGPELRELIVWADISDFEHYMGQLPFPYDNEMAVHLYEAAKADASTHGIAFSHQHYVGGFLEAVYEVCLSRMGLDHR